MKAGPPERRAIISGSPPQYTAQMSSKMVQSASIEAEINRFLHTHRVESLFAYLGVQENASPQQCAPALQAKRRWAQALRNNPKFRHEADWLLRHYRRLLDIMVHQPGAYQAMRARARDAEQNKREQIVREELLQRLGSADAVERFLAESTPPEPTPVVDLDQVGRNIPAPLREGLIQMYTDCNLPPEQLALLLHDEEQRWLRKPQG